MLPVEQFIEFAEQNKLFKPGDKIMAAVSGGMDSVLMAHLLKAASYDFGIAHCNFMLRGDEALADQEFTRRLARQLHVNFYTTSFDTKAYSVNNRVSVQMAARALRYQWFNHICETEGYQVIALAHHQNDAIETILLNLIRGTGIAGLHGILPVNGNLVRPLLFLTRKNINDIIKQEGIAYAEDGSNASVKYVRNKIRHQVIPVLREINPSLEHTFESNLRNFREMEMLLNTKVEELKAQLLIYQDGEVHMLLEGIHQLYPQRLLLFKLLQPYGFTETVVDDLITALHKHAGRLFESTGYRLIIDRGRLMICKKKAKYDDDDQVSISMGGSYADYKNYRLTLLHEDTPLVLRNNPMAVSVDADLLIYPLLVRAWQQGDKFYPLGMKTRQKLSDFFIHHKVPVHKKNEIPVLVNGNGDIIWIGGYRPDDRYKVSDNTKKVTIFGLYKL